VAKHDSNTIIKFVEGHNSGRLDHRQR
jgi:hypothetical protein